MGGFSCPEEKGSVSTPDSGTEIPAELLVLNRFGIGHPYIKAAWRISQKYDIDGREVLLRANILTEDVWLESQHLVDCERSGRLKRFIHEKFLLDQAIYNLYRTFPVFSAKRTFTIAQAVCLFLVPVAAIVALYTESKSVLVGSLLIVTAFYTAVTFMRLFMLAWYDKRITGTDIVRSVSDDNLPHYSLLVPLYKEGNQINDLVCHLNAINWPKNKLDIKLICERDDPGTIGAIEAAKLPDHFETIIVPTASPRTKPKALNYALPLCRGKFLVIYDAEDRPHPNQLREAFSRFSQEGPELACLQAPLLVKNNSDSLITRMFFIEYLTLFNGILPVLARWRLPIPLGGTSNHFNGVR